MVEITMDQIEAYTKGGNLISPYCGALKRDSHVVLPWSVHTSFLLTGARRNLQIARVRMAIITVLIYYRKDKKMRKTPPIVSLIWQADLVLKMCSYKPILQRATNLYNQTVY